MEREAVIDAGDTDDSFESLRVFCVKREISNTNNRENNMRSGIWKRISARIALLCALGISALLLTANFSGIGQASAANKLRFELSFPESARPTAIDGRLFVIIAR